MQEMLAAETVLVDSRLWVAIQVWLVFSALWTALTGIYILVSVTRAQNTKGQKLSTKSSNYD